MLFASLDLHKKEIEVDTRWYSRRPRLDRSTAWSPLKRANDGENDPLPTNNSSINSAACPAQRA